MSHISRQSSARVGCINAVSCTKVFKFKKVYDYASSNPQILKSSNPQILKSSNPQILKSSNPQILSVKTFARLSSLIAILVFQFISTQASATCNSISLGNWSDTIWLTGVGNCSTSPPAATENVNLFSNVTLNQDVTVNSITITLGNVLNASNFTLTLTATETIMLAGGTFNADTSTVKLSNADHSFSVSNLTFYNLQWATPLTAPRIVAINGGVTITKATGGTFNLDGTPTNPVTFAGAGNFGSAVTVNNCAGKPVSMTNLTCNAPIVNNPISAAIGFSLKDKPVIFREEVK